MKLYFVRHGESEANTRHIISNREQPHGLTERGRQQANALAENLSNIPIGSIFCSPVLRARETAEILSKSLNVTYRVTEALREYDCGILEGRSDEESWRRHNQYFENWTHNQDYENKPEGGENFLDIQNRFLPFIKTLKNCPDEHILLIGHGGLYSLMLPLVLSNIDHSFAVAHGIGNAEYVLAQPGDEGLVCVQWGPVNFDLKESSMQ
jgi:probable phosphoglycerate mutase